ncbi:hypothetical protein ZIOFF_043959 [Zingiber officinale]|uniref:Expansin-like CBD domain-containing protein n=1 Tax=Zingiber officinale TaxID=94328 RepID=A0A8J5FY96_ZINOF|nr:hypothetical protein ZIOFF_043959 [Zingiber officinale]
MALFPQLLLFFLSALPYQHLARGDTCRDCFIQSRAAYYPDSDTQGTESGACEYGTFGATLNGGDVSAASKLYRNDLGASGDTDFILSQHAFARMGQNADAGTSLLSLGFIGIEYRSSAVTLEYNQEPGLKHYCHFRVSCSYTNRNIAFKIDESSNYPYYFAFQIWYLQGNKDIIAVQLCETEKLTCKLLERSHGAVWAVASPPSGTLSVRMLLSGSDDGDESWVVPPNNIPQNWTSGVIYDSGIQV